MEMSQGCEPIARGGLMNHLVSMPMPRAMSPGSPKNRWMEDRRASRVKSDQILRATATLLGRTRLR